MIPINIDISGVVDSISNINRDDLSSTVLAACIGSLRDSIFDSASATLNKSRDAYLNGIVVQMNSVSSGSIELQGELANAVEQGMAPRDMKQDLLAGKEYVNIPFRHATPGYGKHSQEFASTMEQDVYDVVKTKSNKEKVPQSELPPRHQIVGRRAPVYVNEGRSKLYDEYIHKVAKYSDIRKESDTTGRSQYKTYRRISENSDPLSWIHPGIAARGIFSEVVSDAQWQLAAQIAVDNYIKSVM